MPYDDNSHRAFSMKQTICEGEYCPLCEGKVIPGLDAVYCQNCKEYYPTQTGLRMEEERIKKKEERLRLAALERKRKKDSSLGQQLLLTADKMSSYSHHEFEENY